MILAHAGAPPGKLAMVEVAGGSVCAALVAAGSSTAGRLGGAAVRQRLSAAIAAAGAAARHPLGLNSACFMRMDGNVSKVA